MFKKVKIRFDAASNSIPVGALIEFEDDSIKTVATASMVLTDEGANVLKSVTVYDDAGLESDDFVMDAILESLDVVPAGAKLSIAGIAGEYTVQQPQKIFWLSDILKAHNVALPTRTKLNLHVDAQDTVTFVITVSGLSEALLTAVTVKVVTSNEEGLAGTNNSVKTMENYIILDQKQIAVNLTQD